jgi:hypothetical protein
VGVAGAAPAKFGSVPAQTVGNRFPDISRTVCIGMTVILDTVFGI